MFVDLEEKATGFLVLSLMLKLLEIHSFAGMENAPKVSTCDLVESYFKKRFPILLR